jgi:hypothetical protein
MNAINVISPYKHNRQWVFDDPRVGLAKSKGTSATLTGASVTVTPSALT